MKMPNTTTECSTTEPLQFEPLLKQIRWGGRKLGTRLGKHIGPASDYAESWELVDHGTDQSRVSQGPWQGRTLQDLVLTEPQALLGRHAGLRQFPLLVKFLDAHDRLSVQVHPNDAQAARYQPGEHGKTEAWVVIDAAPGSCVFAGLKPGVTRAHLEAAIEAVTVESCLNRLPVNQGDCVFIPAGVVHAIGEGVLLAEVQQSSDITFRLFDWNRRGADGQPRPLHIAQSLACTNFHIGPISAARARPELVQPGIEQENLVACPYFHLRRLSGHGSLALEEADRCRIWIITAGRVGWPAQAGGQRKAGLGCTLLWPAATKPTEVQFAPQTQVIEVTWD